MGLNIPRNDVLTPEQAFNQMMGIKENVEQSQGYENLDVTLLYHFENHPFKIKESRIEELVESISEQGVINPLIVRKGKLNGYEILSGHHRFEAAKKAGLEKVPCIVKNVDDDTATMIVVESNKQRGFDDMLPSEVAKALRIEYEAMKRQGKRNDLFNELTDLCNQKNADEVSNDGENETSAQIGQKLNMSTSNARRYIRLTYLVPTLLDIVDKNKISVNAAIELSYIKAEDQCEIVNILNSNDKLKIDIKKAQQLKKESAKKPLTEDKIISILSGEVKHKKVPTAVNIKYKDLWGYVPDELTQKEKQEYIFKALEFYKLHKDELI